MKAIGFKQFGGADQLALMEFPTPLPDDQEVQIQVYYCGVNPVDWKIREGLLRDRLPHEFPIIPGWDVAGVVSAIGKNVQQFRIGDRVFGYCRKPLIKWGTYAEYVCVDQDHLAIIPGKISFAQAAAIPLAALTAWQSLFDTAKLKEGEKILIQAGAGGVGGFAIEFAKYAGAKIYTTASQKNQGYVIGLGASVCIDYTQENVIQKMGALEPAGLDIIYDTVGGKTFQESLQLLKPNGRIVSILETLDSQEASKRNIQAFYVFVAPNGKQLQQIARLLSQGYITPPAIEEFSLADAGKAQEKVRQGHTRGKIVLKVR